MKVIFLAGARTIIPCNTSIESRRTQNAILHHLQQLANPTLVNIGGHRNAINGSDNTVNSNVIVNVPQKPYKAPNGTFKSFLNIEKYYFFYFSDIGIFLCDKFIVASLG